MNTTYEVNLEAEIRDEIFHSRVEIEHDTLFAVVSDPSAFTAAEYAFKQAEAGDLLWMNDDGEIFDEKFHDFDELNEEIHVVPTVNVITRTATSRRITVATD